MPVDEDVFAFRLRQSDDFACSVKWNQNRLCDFRKSNPSLIGGIRVARLMIGATAIWYATLLVFVQMKTVPAAIACLMLAGFSQSLAMISIAVILMRTASAHFRGRVMGVRMLVIYGLPLGLLAAGSLIDEIGFAVTGTLYATAGVALMMAIVLHWRADLWHVHAPANAK